MESPGWSHVHDIENGVGIGWIKHGLSISKGDELNLRLKDSDGSPTKYVVTQIVHGHDFISEEAMDALAGSSTPVVLGAWHTIYVRPWDQSLDDSF